MHQVENISAAVLETGPPFFIIQAGQNSRMIANTEQEKRVFSVIEPQARGLQMEIVRVRVTGGKRPSLQIMAEKEGGAPTDVEDCAALSRAISIVLDAEDPISDAYTLEVSTPGIDRPLTRPGDFDRWVGHAAKIELVRPLNGQRRFRGIITDESNGTIKLQLDDKSELEARLDDFSKASLILTDELIAAAAAEIDMNEPNIKDQTGSAQTHASGEEI
ncbi:MAG: ribosome maturation factor RimP [Pseudomonadota bacterium]